MTRAASLLMLLGTALAVTETAPPPPQAQLVDVRMIWGRAESNTFTDLIRFRDRWYCVFREGRSRTSPDGAVRVLSSAEGDVWQSASLVTAADADLQDPKLSTTPNGLLLLSAGAVARDQAGPRSRTLIWSSSNGRDWDDRVQAGEIGMRLWRSTWRLGRAYSIGFSTPGAGPVREWLKGLDEAERHAIGRDLLKKTRATPDDEDMAIARRRQKELER